ncbi:transcriptional regulator with XRE-family HTH domain [Azospirillum fermentarium]|uniref:helix-turn-helix transcriptional regulator n=1 Tax=Azospirillum fermentarium TaxID=1233114 RepID=UPI0022280A0E|nr:helix-turn-helix domain-containing protein [Azospirillum fermentarium]MCW2244854.1 transcriptional regulator with XRE-family HTH domain [Azospirillum fermentarium]
MILTTDDSDSLERLGRRLRLARLRRNLTQADVADRAGVTRKTYQALEAGRPTAGIGLLVKVLAILGYPGRIASLLETDPIGEDLDDIHGRKRAGRTPDVADF